MHKYYVTMAFFALIVLGALIYGFTLVGGPFSIKRRNEDALIFSDLRSIESRISNYYAENGKLPESLNELPDSNYGYGKFSLTNPITKGDYEYAKMGQVVYELCTEFSGEVKEGESFRSDFSDIFSSSSSRTQSPHKKGHDCIRYEVPKYTIERWNKNKQKQAPQPPKITETPKPVVGRLNTAGLSGYKCEGKLQDGICINKGCTDTDLLDVYKKGTVTTSGEEPSSSEEFIDFCRDGKTLIEGYCFNAWDGTGNYVKQNHTFTCPVSCFAGACVE